MKLNFPYRLFSKKYDKHEYSTYILYRNALQGRKLDVDGKISIPDESPNGEKVLEWLYNLLTVLDAKASALMRLNGVMLAIARPLQTNALCV